MFVLGVCWARDSPRNVLGLQAQILAKKGKFDIKTLHFAGMEHEVVNES